MGRTSAGWQSPSKNRSGNLSPHPGTPDQHGELSDEEDAISINFIAPVNVPANAPSETNSDVPSGEPTSPSPKAQLKKPFFMNWDDFVSFDQSVKHHMPITLSEFDLVIQKRDESNNGWDVCVERPEITISKKEGASGVVMLRAWATVPGLDHRAAFACFWDLNERMGWDKVLTDMKLIVEECQGSQILYSRLPLPAVTTRDFLQYRRARVLEDGTILIVLRSAEHPDVPEQRGVIRAESFVASYVFQAQQDAKGQPVLKIFLMTCTDVKGMIPKWVISYFAPSKPKEWVDSLRKGVLAYQAKHPGYQEELSAYMERFKEPCPFDFEDKVESGTKSNQHRLVTSPSMRGRRSNQ